MLWDSSSRYQAQVALGTVYFVLLSGGKVFILDIASDSFGFQGFLFAVSRPGVTGFRVEKGARITIISLYVSYGGMCMKVVTKS
jgi:hypothetical protein